MFKLIIQIVNIINIVMVAVHMLSGGAHHISSPYHIFIPLLLNGLVQYSLDLTGLFYSFWGVSLSLEVSFIVPQPTIL